MSWLNFYLSFNRNSFLQTVQTLIRHRDLQCLMHQSFVISEDIAGLKGHILTSASSLQCHGTAGLLILCRKRPE